MLRACLALLQVLMKRNSVYLVFVFGGAILGDIRADLYIGQGPEAGLEAGRIRHVLRLYRLVPRP